MIAADIQSFATAFDEIFLLIGAAILIIEIVKGLFEKSFRGRGHLDMIASISTQVPSILIETFVLSLAYLGFILISQNYVTWTLPINAWTVGIALLVCDFVYYWEHRIAHEVRIFWTQHAVHHSSRHMNASVAVRFGPLEGVISVLFHLPLVFLGFPPALIFFGILVVLAYQTWIHTELIGKLGPLDGILNTPANHRVHHGCDDKYIDKNYGGILIIWDRLFGTYERETEKVKYGVTTGFLSHNPIKTNFLPLIQYLKGNFKREKANKNTKNLRTMKGRKMKGRSI